MQQPIQITFRNMDPSPGIEAAVREKASKLDTLYDKITGCHVVIEAPHRRHHQGVLYHVRIDLTVPGDELVVRRDPPEHHAHEDPYVAVRNAFDAIKRQLQDHVRRVRGSVKLHEEPPVGRVVRIFVDEGFGFVETADGREIYFHANSVIGPGFAALEAGDPVRIVESTGDEGPQASTVEPLARPR